MPQETTQKFNRFGARDGSFSFSMQAQVLQRVRLKRTMFWSLWLGVCFLVVYWAVNYFLIRTDKRQFDSVTQEPDGRIRFTILSPTDATNELSLFGCRLLRIETCRGLISHRGSTFIETA